MKQKSSFLIPGVLAVMLLGGCAAEPQDATPTQTQAAEGSDADGEELLSAMSDIDPALSDEASIDDAEAVCLDVERGAERPEIEDNARELFGARAESDLTDEQVVEIVDVVISTYCG